MIGCNYREEARMKDATNGRRRFVATAGFAAVAGALGEALIGREVRADDDHDVEKFIRTVQKARLFDLSQLWDENSPIASVNPSFSTTNDPAQDPLHQAANHTSTRGTFGDGGQLSFTGEVMRWSGQHGAPSIDAIGHIGHNGLLFGGVDAATSTSNPLGIGRDPKGTGANLDIAHYPTELLVNRGVLLDVARFINRSAEPLSDTFNITGDILQDTARHQRVKIKRGDTVLVRTGWGRFFSENPDKYKGANAAGVGVKGAHWLIDQGARVVGNDTLTFEVRPPISAPPEVPQFQVFPVHMLVIADNGINIIENYFLEEIAAAKEYEFLLVVPPLKMRGGTGSGLRSFALVP
jgi:kynurenine formamidase